MTPSRRQFLKTAAATGTLAAVTSTSVSAKNGALRADDISALFAQLPGDVAFKIHAPNANGKKAFVAQQNSDRMLFFASAIKTFVLCEALRQVDSETIVETIEQRALALDSTVWSPGSPIFNPPNITGVVSERTAMEAMITRSDNTATDMMFDVAGADNVRAFIASARLTRTLIPDSTRVFTGYLFGADDYKTISWERIEEVIQGPIVQPFLNPVQTLASSADDMVSYYSRALQGEFFEHTETLSEFRRVLTLCDFIYLVPLPLGVSAYAKSGNVDTDGFHARSIAGGMLFGDHWVFFAFVINWYAAEAEDPGTVGRFFAALNEALTLVKSSLSKD